MTTTAIRSTSVKLDEETKARVKKLADAKQRKPHYLLVEAIQQYVEREEKREQFKQDALRAWEEFQQTGLHATAKEVDDWLAQLEAGNDVEPPQCHN